jgi:hypothetical protein
MANVIVVGGGAAGMMAAIAAAQNHHRVVLLEKNEKLGKKIYITGKGRCNVTNACDRDTFFSHVVSNPRFLYSAFDGFSNWDLYGSLEEWGLPLKVERGERVFPESDKSSDVIRTLQRQLEKLGVDIRLNTRVEALLYKEEDEKKRCVGVKLTDQKLLADAVIVATGGLSYPQTGSDGDGYRFAKEQGHFVTPLYPSLVGFRCQEEVPRRLQGISLKNVEIRILELDANGMVVGKKPVYSGFGEMLFTHFGVSGPLILTASALLAGTMKTKKRLVIDFKPALSEEQLEKRLLRDFEEYKQKNFKTAVGGMLPARLLDEVILASGVSPDKKASEISKKERQAFIKALKEFTLTITGLIGYNEAVVTKGGVAVDQVNPKTMESKLVSGLYFAGEVLDLDAFTGGFNLQIAWSTGYAAGSHIQA